MSEIEEKNKALVRRFLLAADRGDLEELEELLAPDFVDHSLNPGQEADREGYLRSITGYHATFSHSRSSIEYQATDGDMVISRVSRRDIHDRGELMGIRPQGQEHEMTAISSTA